MKDLGLPVPHLLLPLLARAVSCTETASPNPVPDSFILNPRTNSKFTNAFRQPGPPMYDAQNCEIAKFHSETAHWIE